MKKYLGILLAACLLLAGCTQTRGDSNSLLQSELQPVEAASSELPPADKGEPEMEQEEEPVPFGSLMYVKNTDDPFLQQGLSFFWHEVAEGTYPSLKEFDHIFVPAEEMSLSNWNGHSFYELDGYTLDIILSGPFGAAEEELGPSFGLVTLLDERYELECGLRVGMPMDEAKALVEEHVRIYYYVEDLHAENEEVESVKQGFLCWFQYIEGLFDEYSMCLVFDYQLEPDTLGRSLCIYADENGTVKAISSAFCTLP